MENLTLSCEGSTDFTALSNLFIDNYMPAANGSYVKVYIYLLRCLSGSFPELSLSFLAEKLDETEKDIYRALQYWENVHLLTLHKDKNQVAGIVMLSLKNPEVQSQAKEPVQTTFSAQEELTTDLDTPVIVASQKHFDKPSYSDAQIHQLSEIDEVKWILTTVEQYLERPLKPNDIQLVLYLYESIGFSAELILYLYEYCASKNKRNASYIETVALAWAEEGINTVEKAESSSATYSNSYNTINKAFGLNRTPGNIEKQFIHRWFHTFHFELPIIEEACNRAILAVGKPDFKYADKILDNWYKNGVTNLNDIKALDLEHKKQSSTVSSASSGQAVSKPPANRFNAFPQRKYSEEEYTTIEQRLLNR